MKKVLSLVLALSLMLGSLAGCASTATSSSTDTGTSASTVAESPSDTSALEGEITFWHSFTQGVRMEAVQAAADAFMKENPGVKINIETMSWADFNTKWNAGITTGDLPDMSTTCGTGEVAQLVNAGIIQPMDATIDAVGRDLFSTTVLNELNYDGATYGLPYYSHAQVMWVREDLLADAGLSVPTTWDELYDTAVALTKDGVYGCAVSLSTDDFLGTRYLNFYVRSGGGSLLNDDLTANLTSDLAIDGINYWVKMYKNCSPAETINYGINDHATLYYQGITAFDFNSGFMIGGVQSNREDLVDYISCADLPKINESDPYYSAEASHIPLVIYKNTEHADICEAFIAFLFETDNYLEFLSAVPVGMMPSIDGIAETTAFTSNETRQEFAEEGEVILKAMQNGTAIGFEHGLSAQAGLLTSNGIIEKMFQDIIINGTDVEKAAQKAENELNELFETMVG
jgi:multiple sugar transport system substrate-binding protein